MLRLAGHDTDQSMLFGDIIVSGGTINPDWSVWHGSKRPVPVVAVKNKARLKTQCLVAVA